MPGTMRITEETKRQFSLKKKLCTLVEEAFLTLAYGTDGSLGKIMKYKCK